MSWQHYEPPISFARLQAMIKSLELDEPLTKEMKSEIWGALDCFYLTLLIERGSVTRGRRVESGTWVAAALTKRLVDEYGVMVKVAVRAAAPKASLQEHDKIERAYRKLRSGVFKIDIKLHPDLVDQAAERLNLSLEQVLNLADSALRK